jgi:hypothetical protein
LKWQQEKEWIHIRGKERSRRIENMEAEGNERMKHVTEMDANNEDDGVDTETRCMEFVYITNA